MDFKVEVKYNGHTFGVEGTVGSGSPANRRGHPDTWTPADGTEIGIQTVYILNFNPETHAEKQRKLCSAVTAALADDERFIGRVYDAVQEAYQE